MRPAFNLLAWIDEHRHELRPPMANKQVWFDSNMIVMVVGGGNERTDFHDDSRPEFFHQIEGSMVLRIIEAEGEPPVELEIGAGEVFLLPPRVRHSPQRTDPDGIGLVVEYARAAG